MILGNGLANQSIVKRMVIFLNPLYEQFHEYNNGENI